MTFLGRVGSAPISWGVCEAPGWGLQLPVDRVLREAQQLGIRAFEQGALGWLPDDPHELRALLDRYDMVLLGGFVPLVLHDVAVRDAQLAEADRIAATMGAAGGHYFVAAPVPALDDWHHPELSDAEWDEMLANLDRVADICAAHGLDQVVHPHFDTDIETAADFERFLDGCTSKFCLDTGHLTIGGADVLDVARHHADRIGVVHLKDIDPVVAARLNARELTLMEATQAGVFPSLGDGSVPLPDVIAEMEGQGYDGWYVVETDAAITGAEPPPGEGPRRSVARSLDFLRSLT